MIVLEKKTVIDEIVTEMHGRENYLITRVSKNMIADGFPQLYITCLDRETGRPIKGIFCRVGDMKTDYDDIGCYKCMDKDYTLKREGYDVCNAKSLKEAAFKIDYVLALSNVGYDDIFYSRESVKDLDSIYEESERLCNQKNM